MNTYIIIQMQVDSKSTIGNDQTISMLNVVRKVEAETKELAIGKFVLATQGIKATQKLDIECYDITELISLS
jgi:hypothetical protein